MTEDYYQAPEPDSTRYKTTQPYHPKRPRRWRYWLLALLVLLIFFTPVRTNILIIGIDRAPEGTAQGRSDTMILSSMPPFLPQMSLLSIPRDLWVKLPGGGENRINTAHYFAEINQAGSGLKAASQVVELNFGLKVQYTIRFKFDGLIDIVDAMGGININLPEDMSGLTAGSHELEGKAALAFVRDRKGSDDFSRQERGQLFLSAVIKNLFNPAKWVRLPAVAVTFLQAVDSNVPFWLWPRLIYGFSFSALKGFDAHTIDRNMVTPWVTDQGAQVLLPVWDQINPMVAEIFK